MKTAETPRMRAKRLRAKFDRDCANLHLVSAQEEGVFGRYYLRGSKHYLWAEVITLQGGGLLVHGDVETVVFGYYRNPSSARELLHWMADADYSYAEQKARIGGSVAREFDERCARFSVLEIRRRGYIDDAETARDIWDRLGEMDEHGFAAAVYDATEDPELTSVGMVTAERVFMAQAVIAKLIAELESDGWRDFGKLMSELGG